ncbi:MAG: beta propeller repeat protein [Dehalococcoidia bacterium]
MYSKREYRIFAIFLLLVLSILDVCSFYPAAHAADSTSRTLTWSVVKTPAEGPDNVIRRGSEINAMALGQGVIYCVDTDKNSSVTDNGTLFRSTSGGYSFTDISKSLTIAGATLPVWSVALAPDDARFVVAVTTTPPIPVPPHQGPQQVYVSIDGGNSWQSTGIPLDPGIGPVTNKIGKDEWISCLDISGQYGNGFRDISIGTRTETNSGQVLNLKYGTVGVWLSQGISPAAVTSLKFSPNYLADSTLAVISCAAAAALNLEVRDLPTNLPVSWGVLATFAHAPVATVIGTDLALPTDFNGQNPGLQGCFTSIQTDTPFNDAMGRSTRTGVFYINPLIAALPYTITPLPVVSSGLGRRIYSIAYSGSQLSGILLAGETFSDLTSTAMVRVYQSSNAQSFSPGVASWTSSIDYNSYKSPTGGGNYLGFANPILGWGYNGAAYCGTSSEFDFVGGTGWALGQWPSSKLISFPLDESAFSYSSNGGLGWNQIGLIDTQISQLSDSATLEPPPEATQSSVLYLSSLNENTTVSHNFDSVWRSTSDPLGDRWERILTHQSQNKGLILRVNVKSATSTALVLGDLGGSGIVYTADEGQTWQTIFAGVSSLDDIAIRDESTFYVLEDYRVRQVFMGDNNWVAGPFINTDLPTPAHTISCPQVNPVDTDLVFIGTGLNAPGNPQPYVAWIDFASVNPQLTVLKTLPGSGNVHVIVDTKYDQNRIIYAAVNSDISPSSEGSIYRWVVGSSTDWDELEPINRAFFGIAMTGDVLYGAWNLDTTTLKNSGGVDRTLYPRIKVPPAPDWDELKDGLPLFGDANFPVLFNREPASLKISSNTNNTLWAIDNDIDIPTNRLYNFDKKIGCLWQYIDSVARVSPWPTAPPSGSFIGADPVTGRSQQVDIKWRPLKDIFAYDLLLAKDVNFTMLLSQSAFPADNRTGINIYPVDNKTGAWVVGVDTTTGKPIITFEGSQQLSPGTWIPPGILEAGRSYYWKVRGSRTITGSAIHSLWSAVMFFSVKPGFAVRSIGTGPQLLTPVGGVCDSCQTSVGFSWTPIKNASKYQFILAYDQDLQKTIVQTITTTTAYKYEGRLEPGRIYFWQVKAVAPFESDPSPTGTFVVGSGPQFPWQSLPTSYLWIAVIIGAAILLVLIIAIFVYNYMHRY